MFVKAASLITARNVLVFSLVAEGATGLVVVLASGLVAPYAPVALLLAPRMRDARPATAGA